MTFKQHGRDYDVVVFGATGYTGKLTAEHITTHLPTNLKWAVAGRSQAKLEKLVEDVKALNPDRAQPAVEVCDLEPKAVTKLAEKTFVMLATIGPYAKYGEPAFKACAESGTHYLDVTGETPFVANMIKKYEATAKMTGAIMVPEAGVESSPPDLLTYALVGTNRTEFGAETKETIHSLHKMKAGPSGGTFESVFNLFDTFSLRDVQRSLAPFALSPIPHPAPVPGDGLLTTITGLRTVPNLGLQGTGPTARVDDAVIMRSWGLMSTIPSRQKESYGPNFSVKGYAKMRNHFTGFANHIALLYGTILLNLSPFRKLARRFVYKPGDGPTKEESANDEVEFRGVAWPSVEGGEGAKGAGKQAWGRAGYHGSLYMLTAIFLAQGALTILEEDLELEGGVYTPACLGQPFIDRLAPAGFRIETRVIDEK